MKLFAYVDGAFDRELNLYGAGAYLNRGLSDDDEFFTYGKCYNSTEAEVLSAYHLLVELDRRNEHDKELVVYMDCVPMLEKLNRLENYLDDELFLKVYNLSKLFKSVKFEYRNRDWNCAHVLSKMGLEEGREKYLSRS